MVVKNRRQSLVSFGLLVVLLGLLVIPAIVQADNNPPARLLTTPSGRATPGPSSHIGPA